MSGLLYPIMNPSFAILAHELPLNERSVVVINTDADNNVKGLSFTVESEIPSHLLHSFQLALQSASMIPVLIQCEKDSSSETSQRDTARNLQVPTSSASVHVIVVGESSVPTKAYVEYDIGSKHQSDSGIEMAQADEYIHKFLKANGNSCSHFKALLEEIKNILFDAFFEQSSRIKEATSALVIKKRKAKEEEYLKVSMAEILPHTRHSMQTCNICSQNVCNRFNLKPQNFMFEAQQKVQSLKIVHAIQRNSDKMNLLWTLTQPESTQMWAIDQVIKQSRPDRRKEKFFYTAIRKIAVGMLEKYKSVDMEEEGGEITIEFHVNSNNTFPVEWQG
eukprot:Gb_05330 [translate_table: standard]